MKKRLTFLLSSLVSLVALTGSVFASTGIAINNAYIKSDGTYAVVVKEVPGVKLALYVNDKDPASATANKKGWATFRGVKLAGDNGKISFARVFKTNGNTYQKPINYVRYYKLANSAVSFLAANPVKPATTATPKTAVSTPAPAPTPTVQPVTPTCTNGTYVNSAGNTVCSPEAAASAPAGATAQCRDGTYSFSQSHSGTCSHHGGVSEWL